MATAIRVMPRPAVRATRVWPSCSYSASRRARRVGSARARKTVSTPVTIGNHMVSCQGFVPSAGGAEPFDADPVGRDAGAQQDGGWRRRRSRPSRTRRPWPPSSISGARSPTASRPDRPGDARRRDPGVDDGGLRAGQLVGVVEVGRGCAPTRPAARGRAAPVRRARRSIAISGTTPEPPPTSRAGASPSHTNQPPIGPRTSSSSPGSTTSWRKADTSPSSSRSTVSSNSVASSGADATEYERWRRVAVGRGEADDEVLAGPVPERLVERRGGTS